MYNNSSTTYNAADVVYHSRTYGEFSIAIESIIELQNQCELTINNSGFGVAANFTTEVYSDIRIWRIGEYVAP